MTNLSSAAAALGKKGGSSTSEAKQCASRENGKLGGRPRRYEIANSWSQVDGGTRFLIETSDGHEITVDIDGAGKLSGFVRGVKRLSSDDERSLLSGAFRIVKREMME